MMTLLALLVCLTSTSAMAGTNAARLRRPVFRHTASGALPVVKMPRNMDETIRIAKQYAKAPIAGPAAVDFKLKFDACQNIPDVRAYPLNTAVLRCYLFVGRRASRHFPCMTSCAFVCRRLRSASWTWSVRASLRPTRPAAGRCDGMAMGRMQWEVVAMVVAMT